MGLSSNSVDALVAGAVGIVADALTPKEQKDAERELAMMEMLQKISSGQLAVNAAEGANSNMFVAGWRPAVGWTCVTAFAITFVLLPILTSCVVYYSAFTGENVDLSGLPEMNMGEMMPVLLGMLGLGGLRTYEKTRGIAR